MIGFGDGDLSVFTGDMGVAVTFGGVTVQGLIDESDITAVTSDGQVEGVVRGTTLTLAAPDLAQLVGLTIDSVLTVDARSFVVREFLKVDDGKIRHLVIAETTQTPDEIVSVEIDEA